MAIGNIDDFRIPTLAEIKYTYTARTDMSFRKKSTLPYWTSTESGGKVYKRWIFSSHKEFLVNPDKSSSPVKCVSGPVNTNLKSLQLKVKSRRVQKEKEWAERYTVIFQRSKESPGIDALEEFVKKYPEALDRKDAIREIYNRVKLEEGIVSLERFVAAYPDSETSARAVDEIYTRVMVQNKLDALVQIVDKYPHYSNRDAAINAIYSHVAEQNSIEAYRWYSTKYSKSNQARHAVKNMYSVAFATADKIGTLEAYNDFIIAYPYAPKVKEATAKAYSLEKEKYSEWFSSDEKNSRALLIQSKRLARKMNELENTSEGKGYLLVIDRMSELLQDEYPAEEATLRYLESEEFRDFVKEFKTTMQSIKTALADINDNTSDLSEIMREQSRMMDTHFKKNAYSQQMANEYTKQYQDWERHLKPYGVM